MSGFVALFYRDGRPVDQALLQSLVDALCFRGPDAQDTWRMASVGMGHTLLRTTREAEREHQPLTLDGQTYLVGDVRLDRRDELIAALGERAAAETLVPDSELLLRAYHRWGEKCVEHLLGEFAFAIWDGNQRKLFCARDHFGVKALYYTEVGSAFVCSNDLRCLRRFPGLKLELNEQALVDFLVFEYSRERNTTAYAEIRKLPAAHTLVVSAGQTSIAPYWKLEERSTRYKRQQEYVDHFLSLMDRAVQDQARTSRVSIFLSGGVDSTAVAACLRAVARKEPMELKGFTAVEERVAADPEKKYSAIAAKFLNIGHELIPLDEFKLFQSRELFREKYPEPSYQPFSVGRDKLLRGAASFSRVVFDGDGGDPAFLATHASSPLSLSLLSQMARSFVRIAAEHRRLPKVGVRTVLRPREQQEFEYPVPSWLRPEVATRVDMAGRLQRLGRSDRFSSERATAYEGVADVMWQAGFESLDAELAVHHMEGRHPFFDLTLLQFVLSLPPLPWFVEKYLVRRAMRGRLPREILIRPKTRLQHSKVESRKDQVLRFATGYEVLPQVRELVRWDEMLQELQTAPEQSYEDVLHVVCLDLWIRESGAPT